MDWSSRRRRGLPPVRSLAGSLGVHAAAATLAVVATLRSPEPLEFITYEIELVSPPAQEVAQEVTVAQPEEELTIETPDQPEPEPPAEEEVLPDPEAEPPPEPEPEPEPEVEPEEPEPEPTPAPEEEVAEPTTTEEPEEEEELTGEDLNVRMEGVRRDYPQYYANIIRQIDRCFRPPSGLPGGLTTTVYFEIRRDGTATEVRFVNQSGNPGFDFEALGAIADCASGRFGPLPDDLPYERLPIQFEFRPRGGGLVDPAVPGV